ncbi:unnamed protein product [Ixodes hexagonus]
MLLRPLLLVLSIAAATSDDACGQSGCLCTPTNGANDVFMHCANRSLTQLPEFPPEPKFVVGLDAGHNSISKLTKFQKLPLKLLDLHYNRIGDIPVSVFSELDSLEVLDLSHNNIMELQPQCFQGLKKLLVLNLTENFIETIQPKAFHEVPLLKQLALAGNSLKMIDSQWFSNMVHVEHLDLRLLAVSSLPEDVFHSLPALTLLELSSNDFQDVPTAALRGAKSLKILHLEHNPITTLSSKSFEGLMSIEELHLSSMPNLVTVEDSAFGSMSSLRILDLANNPLLNQVSGNAFYVSPSNQSTALTEVYLAYGNLSSLPFVGFDWCSITLLDLRGNPWRCDCSLSWIRSCQFAPELTYHFLCSEPPELSGLPVIQLTEEDLRCTQLSPARDGSSEDEHHHGHMSLRLLVVTAGLVILLMVLGVVLIGFRRRDIRDWIQNRKRVGAVYYVKAQTEPGSRRLQV